MKKKLNIGFITTVSGRWPRELPNERLAAYSEYINAEFPDANIVEFDKIIDTTERIEEAAEVLKSKSIDILIMVYGAFTGDDVGTFLAGELNVPIILWAPPEPKLETRSRLFSNALVCLTMNSASIKRLGYTCYGIYGHKEDPATAQKVKDIIETYTVVKKLKYTLFGLFGYRPTAFYNSAFDEGLIRKVFGIRMEETDLKVVFDRMNELDMGRVLADFEKVNGQFTIDDIPEEYKMNHSKLFLSLGELMEEMGYDFATIKCWPEMGVLKTTPCAVLGRLMDENKLIACEGDIDASLAMVVENYLTDKAVFITDLIDINEDENYLTFWHCGNAAPSIHADTTKTVMRDHPLAGQGSAFDTPLKKGEVTIARFCNIHGVYKLFLTKGEAIDTNVYTPGSMVNVKTDAKVRDVIEYIIEQEVPHHYAIVWEDVAEKMKKICEVLDIEVLEI